MPNTVQCWCRGNCQVTSVAKDLMIRNEIAAADFELRRVLTTNPNCPRAHLIFAQHLGATNRAALGLAHMTMPDDWPESAIARGRLHRLTEDMEASQEILQDAVSRWPENVGCWDELIATLEMQGKNAEARARLDEAMARFPEHRSFVRVRATLAANDRDYDTAIATLTRADVYPIELLDRGRYRDRIGDIEGAWSDWMTGKARMQSERGLVWNEEIAMATIEGLRLVASSRRWRRFNDIRTEMAFAPATQRKSSYMPIFVTGFPRSGTTLLETCLSRHPKIAAGDELQFLHDVADRLPNFTRAPFPYPLAMLSLSFGDNRPMARMLSDLYLQWASAKIKYLDKSRTASFFTDKMPLNEIHLPLIRILFPAARVIYPRRHPLDVILSNLSYPVTHHHNYAADLSSCARYYLEVDKLIQHYKDSGLWQNGYDNDVVEFRYEDFVSAPIKLLKKCVSGLVKYDSAMEKPNDNKRSSRTISYMQVREPIYKTSVARYTRYLDKLAPAIPLVRAICEREGYTI